jgi:hypothetical protein
MSDLDKKVAQAMGLKSVNNCEQWGTSMKITSIFTDEELALIDSGKYTPGRAALDAKLDLAMALEREACKKLAKEHAAEYKVGGRLYTMLGMNTSKPAEAACDHIAHLISERSQAMTTPTQEDIIRMGKEADLITWGFQSNEYEVVPSMEAVERFAALVAAAENEACAKVVEEMKGQCWAYDHDTIAAAIRARGQA